FTEFARAVNPNNRLDGFSFAVHVGIIDLRNPPTCDCGKKQFLSQRVSQADSDSQGLQWKCKCAYGQPRCKNYSITSGTWFENTKLNWTTIFELCLHWFFQTPVSAAAGQTGVSKVTAVYWYTACRDVCANVVTKLDMCIGGQDLHVEIDETHLFRRKYRRGRVLAHEDVWVFGGICRESKEAFVELVADRKGETLWPLIMRRISPGTTIISDSARVYNSLHQPNRGGFNHFQVNHRYNFVDPQNSLVHTNTIERQWGLLKSVVKGTVDDHHLEMYLGEYIYRRMFLKTTSTNGKQAQGHHFLQFLKHVKEEYSGK
ncbi:MAG: IS1595 family transposase, partial [Bacteroidota bacterium]